MRHLKDVSFLLTIYFLVFLGFNFFYIAFPVHAVQALSWDLTATGTFFSFLSRNIPQKNILALRITVFAR